MPTASTASTAADAGVSDHAVNLTTQLTTHVMSNAPVLSRLAEATSSLPSGAKSALAAAAVTAVAAVSVPVAVHTVQEVQGNDRPAPAVAAPVTSTPKNTTTTVTGAAVDPKSAETTTTTVSTSTTLPLSQTHPFEGLASPSNDTTSTTAPPRKTTATTVAPAQGTVVQGKLTTNDLTANGGAPQWDLDGTVTLTVGNKTSTGTLAGRVYVYDDGTAESDDLALVVGGKTLDLRFRGNVVNVVNGANGSTTYDISGAYLLTNASEVGLADRGNLAAAFQPGDAASLQLAFSGRSSS